MECHHRVVTAGIINAINEIVTGWTKIFFFRFPEENENMKLFKTYSKKACEFECALEKSEKYCRCRPWNYPRSDDEYNNTILCDMFGNYCFHQAMMIMDNYHSDDCDCPQNCDEIAYIVFKSREYLNPLELCSTELISSHLVTMILNYICNSGLTSISFLTGGVGI